MPMSSVHRLKIAAQINQRLRAAKLDSTFDFAGPCAHGVILFVSMEPGCPSLQAIQAVCPGCEINEKAGTAFWPC
jgi:hypothetical protein